MITARFANRLWHLAARRHQRQFARAMDRPESIQSALLKRLLRRNAATQFGRACDFSNLTTIEDFQNAVPLSEYADYEGAMAEIARGGRQILTSDPVTRFVPTSGSTSARKLIPWTTGLQRDFDRAIGAWVGTLFSEFPDLKNGPAYWSVSPAIPEKQDPDSVIRIGFDDDTSYLGGLAARAVGRIMAVPSEVRLATDTDDFRYLVLLHLAAARDLRLVSVWHPTFFSLLLDSLPDHVDRIIESLDDGRVRYRGPITDHIQRRFRPNPERAGELRAIDPGRPESLWPHLGLISAWGGPGSPELDDLTRRFPKVRFQAKGLLATEACITIPFAGQFPLAITSHFFEFADEAGAVHLAHELELARRYEVVVTTSGGLYRYRLGDQVEVNGMVGRTPSLKFLGRVGAVSDLRGEKLDARFVADAIQQVVRPFANELRFRLLVAEVEADHRGDTPQYVFVFVAEHLPDLESLARELEEALCANPHYRLCRFLGQLRPLRVYAAAAPAIDAYFAWRRARGQKLGNIKPAVIDSGPGLLAALGANSAAHR